MKTKLPTKLGPYWWREPDSTDPKDWQPVIVVRRYDDSLVVVSVGNDRPVPLENCEGQWSPCHKPDEGVEAWAVYAPDGTRIELADTGLEAKQECGSPYPAAWEKLAEFGFTCQKVRVFKEVEG